MCELCENKKRIGEICLDCYRQKIQEAKKEVFDDIEDMLYKIPAEAVNKFQLSFPFDFKEIKQRHLSTFADGKSDIIADKQNPQRLILLKI